MKKNIKAETDRGSKTKIDPTTNAMLKSKITHLKHKATTHIAYLIRTKRRKIIAIIITAILILVVVFGVPFTRYGLLHFVIKKDVTVIIIDSKSKQPVSNALVNIGNILSQTDKNGVAKLRSVPVGQVGIAVHKKYYQAFDRPYTVPVLFNPESPKYEIFATGRQVTFNVVNKITGQPIEDAVIVSSQTKATTNAQGRTDLILAPIPDIQQAMLTRSGYNSSDVQVKVSEGVVNEYTLTPSGSVYFLSNATGKINVMKSNLDGTNPTVAVQGTGEEVDHDTSLLSARDWQYSALLATRTDNKQAVYLFDSTKKDLSLMDSDNALFNAVGWSGHNFIYTAYRKGLNLWDNNVQALKSFNADTRTITVLDQSLAHGNNIYDAYYQSLGNIYIFKNNIVYLKSWSGSKYNNLIFNNDTLLVSADIKTGDKSTIKSFPVNANVSDQLYRPQSLYISVFSTKGTDPSTFYEYKNSVIHTVTDTSDSKFNAAYRTFLVSPSGNRTLWYEPRDGKNTIFIGDDNGSSPLQIINSSDYTPYGWYGANDEYILLTKNGSELYIAPATVVIRDPLKVTDYHKGLIYPNYGYGYGGQ